MVTLHRLAVVLAGTTLLLGVLTGPAVAASVSAAAPQLISSDLPTHGVDKNGRCKPQWGGNYDCYHYGERKFKTLAACRKANEAYAAGGIPNYCEPIKPEGYYKQFDWSPECKQSETLESCARRNGH